MIKNWVQGLEVAQSLVSNEEKKETVVARNKGCVCSARLITATSCQINQQLPVLSRPGSVSTGQSQSKSLLQLCNSQLKEETEEDRGSGAVAGKGPTGLWRESNNAMVGKVD